MIFFGQQNIWGPKKISFGDVEIKFERKKKIFWAQTFFAPKFFFSASFNEGPTSGSKYCPEPAEASPSGGGRRQ